MARRETFARRRDIARRRLAEGIPADQIISDFLEWGIDDQHARDAVARALEQRRKDQVRDCVQPIWVGGSMLGVGILMTLIGLERSIIVSGQIHRYLIMGVAILPAAAAYAVFGLIHLISYHRGAHSDGESETIAEAPNLALPQSSVAESSTIDVERRLAA